MNKNTDYIKREDVIQIIIPRLNSPRPGSLEHQRMYSILHEVKKLHGEQVNVKEIWRTDKCEITFEKSVSSKECRLSAIGIGIPTANLANKELIEAIKQKLPHFCFNEIVLKNDKLHIAISLLHPAEYPQAVINMIERGNLDMEWKYEKTNEIIEER